MQALSCHLICVSSGPSNSNSNSCSKLFIPSGKRTSLACSSSSSSSCSCLPPGVLRQRRSRGEIVVSFRKKYRREFYYVEKVEAEEGGEQEEEAAWEGAIIFKKSMGHMEYCTTLERVGLSRLSSEASKSTAASMGMGTGIRVNTDFPDPFGTPLLVSIDVTRKKPADLLLHGLIRTFISLPCNRCAEQAAQRVFKNFCLLLHEKPLKEDDQMTEVKLCDLSNDEDGEEELDQMHFPLEEKEIDISKYIRDIVHLEITINALCDPNCKGLCLKCGTNLNRSTCECGAQKKAILYESS